MSNLVLAQNARRIGSYSVSISAIIPAYRIGLDRQIPLRSRQCNAISFIAVIDLPIEIRKYTTESGTIPHRRCCGYFIRLVSRFFSMVHEP